MGASPSHRRSKWILSSGPEDNSALSQFCNGLFSIQFKPLIRPNHDPPQGRSTKELRWCLRVFTATSFSFFRDLLRTYLVLRREHLEAASFIVLRSMYEAVCGAHYVEEHYVQYLRTDELQWAWEMLEQFSVGSKFLKGQRAKDPINTDETPVPVKLWETINSFDSIFPNEPTGWAYEFYRLLSEFSHPDHVSCSHYFDFCAMKGTHQVTFYAGPELDKGYLRTTTGFVALCAGQVYGKLFRSGELHTAERSLSRLMVAFRKAEEIYPKPIPKGI